MHRWMKLEDAQIEKKLLRSEETKQLKERMLKDGDLDWSSGRPEAKMPRKIGLGEGKSHASPMSGWEEPQSIVPKVVRQ